MNDNQMTHIYDLSNDISTDLIQRVINGDLSITDAMNVLAIAPMMMMFRTLPKEVIDDTLEKRNNMIASMLEVANKEMIDNPMAMHEFITAISRSYELLIRNIF